MATRFELVLYGDEPARLRAAGEGALQEVEVLDRQLSFYRTDSDISWINAGASREPVKVEPQLFRLLQRAAELSRATQGAFDITVGPLMRAWGLTGEEGKVPSAEELAQVRELVGMSHVCLNEMDSTIRFDSDSVEIELGAIGKGYAIERAVEALQESGVGSALIHGGTSTIYGLGAPPDADAWTVGIRDPGTGQALEQAVNLRDSALSVSAVHGKSFTREGREYGHVIDPRTGEPSAAARLTAVWGPSPTDADALSTALLVLGQPGISVLEAAFPEYQTLVL